MKQQHTIMEAARAIDKLVHGGWQGQAVTAEDITAHWDRLIPYQYYQRLSAPPDPRQVRVIWDESARLRGNLGLCAPVGVRSPKPVVRLCFLSPPLKAAHRFHQGLQRLLANFSGKTVDLAPQLREICVSAMLPDLNLPAVARLLTNCLPQTCLQRVLTAWTNLPKWAESTSASMPELTAEGPLFSGGLNLPLAIEYLMEHSLGTINHRGLIDENNPRIHEIRPRKNLLEAAAKFFKYYRAAPPLRADGSAPKVVLLLGAESGKFWENRFGGEVPKIQVAEAATLAAKIGSSPDPQVWCATDFPVAKQ